MPVAAPPESAHRFANEPARLLVNGEFVEAQSGERFGVIDPATEKVVAEAARVGQADVDAAVGAARQAFDDGRWSDLALPRREEILNKPGDLMEAAAPELAHLNVLEVGMPLMFSEFEVGLGLGAVRFYAGWP